MATLSNIKGRRVIQASIGRKRKTLYLGRVSERDARAVKAHIEHLAMAKDSGLPVPMETARWLTGVSDAMHLKLSRIGLAEPRQQREIQSIGPYFQKYIDGRTDLKRRTILNLEQSKKSLVDFFGADRDMEKITRGDAKDWYRKASAKYAAATVAMYAKKARQLYADAMDRKLLSENPFRALKIGDMTNPARLVYVPAADIHAVIDKCPDDEWKLIFSLARFAGLRVPSETRALRWSDVLWDEGKMRVRSSKTEHHAGKDTRLVPIFPELLPLLLSMFSKAEPGAKHVIVRLRGDNLNTTANKLIERAGLTAWPKTFQNLRSSCETDLTASFPIHVVCAWIGNSAPVAMKHYLQVTDAHFALASGSAAKSAVVSAGQDRTETGHGTQKRRKSPVLVEPGLPPREAQLARLPLEMMQAAHQALQNALHRITAEAPKTRKRLIAELRNEVRAARKRGRP